MAYVQSSNNPELQTQKQGSLFIISCLSLALAARQRSLSEGLQLVNDFSEPNCFTGDQKLESSFGGE